MSSVSLDPILFTQVPALDTVQSKLLSFIDAAPSDQLANKDQTKKLISNVIFPWLKLRFAPEQKGKTLPTPSATLTGGFSQAVSSLTKALPPASLFPLLDVWRLALLDPAVAQATLAPLTSFLAQVQTSAIPLPRATMLTLLRLLSNALGSLLARPLLSREGAAKSALTQMLVQTLLHEDKAVRIAAASLAFNAAAWVQRGRVARTRGDAVQVNGAGEGDEDEDWEVELVTAVVEALGNETDSEDAGKSLLFYDCGNMSDQDGRDSASSDGHPGIARTTVAVLRNATRAPV